MISGRRRWLLVATLCLACGWLGVVWLNHAATGVFYGALCFEALRRVCK